MKSFAYVIIPKCFLPLIDFDFGYVVLYSEYLHRNLNRFTLSPQVSKSKLTKASLLIMSKLLRIEFSIGTLGKGNHLTPFLHSSKILFQLSNFGNNSSYFLVKNNLPINIKN